VSDESPDRARKQLRGAYYAVRNRQPDSQLADRYLGAMWFVEMLYIHNGDVEKATAAVIKRWGTARTWKVRHRRRSEVVQ
jgi:hypothetical protein